MDNMYDVYDTPEKIAFDIKIQYALSMRGKYLKQCLTQLEKYDLLDSMTRKIVLDSYGDYGRELEKILRG